MTEIVLTQAEQDELLKFLRDQYLNPNQFPLVSKLYDRIEAVKLIREAAPQ